MSQNLSCFFAEKLREVYVEKEPPPLTTYFARHSFATTQKNNGVPTAYIKESLGQSSIQTTEIYLGSFEDEDLKSMHDGLLAGLVY